MQIKKKLESTCQEVRNMAIKNLESKLQCGLITFSEIDEKHPEITSQLIKIMITQDDQYSHKSLSLLVELSKLPNSQAQIKPFVQELLKYNYLQSDELNKIISNAYGGDGQIQRLDNQILQIREQQQVKILQKPELSDFYQLNHIVLVESDEKLLFDTIVQLKYGNQNNIFYVLKDVLPQIIQDFPPEVFVQKYEIIQDTIALINYQNISVAYYALRNLKLFIKSLSSQPNYPLKSLEYFIIQIGQKRLHNTLLSTPCSKNLTNGPSSQQIQLKITC
ncbi:hypothetical protein pb186bvf_014339 [Paramecium bursaria]